MYLGVDVDVDGDVDEDVDVDVLSDLSMFLYRA